MKSTYLTETITLKIRCLGSCGLPETSPRYVKTEELMYYLERTDDHMLQGMDAGERRLLTFHERIVTSLFRKDAVQDEVDKAIAVGRDHKLLRKTVEFVFDENDYHNPWLKGDGVGSALQTYIDNLGVMSKAASNTSGMVLSEELRSAFDAVVVAARALDAIGWPVNWTQNVQVILELSEFGVVEGKLVNRYEGLPDTMTLGERIGMLGGLAFFKQTRVNDRTYGRNIALVGNAALEHRDIPVFLDRVDGVFSTRFRYSSDWTDGGKPGRTFRVMI